MVVCAANFPEVLDLDLAPIPVFMLGEKIEPLLAPYQYVIRKGLFEAFEDFE